MTFLDPADAPEAKARLEALPAHIPQILTLEAGLDVVGSAVSAHLLLLTTHESVEMLQAYQGHPVHEEFGAWVRPRLASRHVADVEV
jgi:hypothetical protein